MKMPEKMYNLRFVSDEVEQAYKRGEKLAHYWGSVLFEIDPTKHKKVPSDISRHIGVGAAAAIWTGIHHEGAKQPFARDTPAYGFFKAGVRWAKSQIETRLKKVN